MAETPRDKRHYEHFFGLSAGERALVGMKKEVYEGSWDGMVADLRDRLAKRPYIAQLEEKIQTDMGAIERLRAYEQEHGVDLSDYYYDLHDPEIVVLNLKRTRYDALGWDRMIADWRANIDALPAEMDKHQRAMKARELEMQVKIAQDLRNFERESGLDLTDYF